MKRRGPALTPLLLRVPEVAILVGLSERQVWTLIREGKLRTVRPPGIRVLRVARDEVDALVAEWRGEAQPS